MSDNNKLRTCSRCHSTILESYFGINKKGELYKVCDNCRNKTNAVRTKKREEIKAFNIIAKIELQNRLNMFKTSVKYFETGDMEFYDPEITKYVGTEEIPSDKYKRCIQFCQSQIKWIEEALALDINHKFLKNE